MIARFFSPDSNPKTSSAVSSEEANNFLEAARTGNLKAVREYTEKHAGNADALNVTSQKHGHITALALAAQANQLNIVLALRDVDGIDVNKAGWHGKNPLTCAAINAYVDIIEALLESPKIDVLVKFNGCQTPLYLAVTTGRIDAVRPLLNFQSTKITNEFADQNRKSIYAAHEYAQHNFIPDISNLLFSTIDDLYYSNNEASATPARPSM
jgi:ankyrin repeat protein